MIIILSCECARRLFLIVTVLKMLRNSPHAITIQPGQTLSKMTEVWKDGRFELDLRKSAEGILLCVRENERTEDS
jgi:hypothetical protein